MYYILAMIVGLLITAMIVINGQLGSDYGVYLAAVIVHIVGFIGSVLIVLFKKERIKPLEKLPIYFFTGGLVGLGTTVFSSMAFGKISVSAILGLGLLGQSISSLLVDHYGWFGMQKQKFNTKKIAGLMFVLVGIFIIMLF